MEKLKDKRVLIVDDEERNVFALGSYLETFGMETTIARNGEDAISMLETGLDPDIVLMDMMMPVMDGYETLSIIRQNTELKNIPIIAVTAKAMMGDREKCLEAGAWDYISKPVDLKLLIEKMDHWIP